MISYVELRLYTNAAHTQYSVLPDFAGLSFDKQYNQISAINFEYPALQAQVLGLGDQDFVGVAMGYTDGTVIEVERFVLEGTDDDKVSDDSLMRKLSGRSIRAVLDDAVVYPSNWPVTTPSGHDFVSATPGTIWRTLVLRAKTRGTFPQLVETSFSGTQDTAGAVWATTLSQTFSSGTSYTQVLQDMLDRGLVDARMTGWNLEIYNGGALGRHIAVGSLEVRPASNVTEMSTTTDSSESCSVVLIEGEAGTAIERTDANALTTLGRRRERFVTQGGIADAGILAILGDAELAQYARIQTEETVGISDFDNLEPFKDFDAADWVWVRYDSTSAPVERRIRQIAVSVDADRNLTIGLTLNTILAEQDVKLQRRVDSYTGASGTYGPTPNSGVDFTIPSPPAGLGVQSSTFVSNQGVYTGAFSGSWVTPGTNADGSSLADLSFFELQWRYTTGTDTDWKAVIRTSGTETVLGYSPVTPGRDIEVKVRAVDKSGNRSAFTSVVAHTVATDTSAPLIPSTPTVTAAAKAIRIVWDGKSSTNGAMDADLAYAEVWVSPVTGFVPGDANSLKVSTFSPGGGTFVYAASVPNQPYYARLLAVDKAGNKGAASGQAFATPNYGDGVAPGAVTSVTTLGGLGQIFVKWGAVVNNDPVRYRVYATPASAATFPYDGTTLVADTAATTVSVKALTDGTPFTYDTTYLFAVVSYDDDGTGTASPVASDTMDRTASGDLKANSVTGAMLAGIVVLGTTISTRTLVTAPDGITQSLTGPGIDLTPDGMFTYDSNGEKRVELPNVGTYTFRGDAEIDHLTVQTLTTLQQTLVAAGSSVSLQNSVANPSNPPTATINYTTVQHTDDGLWGDRHGLTSDGTFWYTVRTLNTGYVVEKWNSSGTLVSTHTESPAGRAQVAFGIIYVGTTLYVLYWDTFVNLWGVAQFNTSLTWLRTAILTTSGPEAYAGSGDGRGAGIGYDPTGNGGAGEFIIAQSRVSNGDKVRFQRYTISGTAATARATFDTTFAYGYWIGHVTYGTFDFGTTAKYVFGNYGSSSYQIANPTTGAQETPTYGWDNPTSGNRGMWYDGANFWAVSTSGLRYKFETGNQWTNSADATWYVGYTWRNSVTPAETMVSPLTTVTMKKRARLVVSTPALPVGVTEARTYFAKTTKPDTTAQTMTLAGSTTGTTQPSRTHANVLFTPLNNPALPTGSTFAASGTPASVVSTDSPTNPKISLKGDGSGRVGPLSWDASGNVLTQPSDPGKVDTSALLFGRKTAASSTTGTSPVASGLSLTLAVGTYTFVMRGQYQAAAATTGIGMRVGGTAVESAMFAEVLIAGGTNSTTAPWFSRTLAAMGQAASATTGVQAAATPAPFRVEGFIIVSTAGTITLDFQSQVSGSAVQINAGSSIQAVKVA